MDINTRPALAHLYLFNLHNRCHVSMFQPLHRSHAHWHGQVEHCSPFHVFKAFLQQTNKETALQVHKHGSVPANSDELLQAVTGEPLNVAHFVEYLTAKYSSLYKLSL
jgi:Zn-dependent M32 family carboxypeptidase